METILENFLRRTFCLQLISKKLKSPNARILVMTALQFHTFPRVIPEFNTYLGKAMERLDANSPRLISADKLDELHLLFDTSIDPDDLDWKALWEKYSDSTAVTTPVRNSLKAKRHQIEHFLLDVFEDIPKSVWTEDDRTVFRRPLRSTNYKHAHVMEVAPDIEVTDILHLGLRLHLHNPETPESDEMPEYQHIFLEWFVGPANTDKLTIVPTNSHEVHRTPHLLVFEIGDLRKRAFIRGYYVNSKGEKSLFTSRWVEHDIS